ncbi:MAG: tetratricopeptide repeat protein [Muribaculaceae bacterium]|nr:tetratricopeptide repeat protein [Muribaculaceae bacterium]
MKQFTTLIIIVAIIVASNLGITAQTLSGGYDDSTEYFDSKKHNKWRNSANFKKALAILNNENNEEDIDYDAALTLLQDEFKQHPGNGYAVCSAAIARENEDTGDLSMFIIDLLYGDNKISEDEVENLIQKRFAESKQVKTEVVEMLELGISLIPAADKENLCKAYITYGNLQVDLEDTEKALAAYEQAATILPCYQSYDILMKFCLDHGDNDKALQYASKLGDKIDEDNEALCKLAKVYIDNNDYDKAKTLINKAIANDDSDSDAYQQLFNMLIAEGNYQEALDKTIDCYKKFQGSNLFQNISTIYDVNDDCKTMVISKLHQLEAEMSEVNDDDKQVATEWSYFEGLLYYFDKDYRSALICFDKLLERKPSAPLLSLKADCHYMLGDAPQALKILNYALRMPEDSEGISIKEELLKTKIRIEMWCGMNEEQIYDSEIYCKAFGKESTLGYGTLVRGYINKGQYAKALEVCDEWSEQYEDDIDAKYNHALVLAMWGKNDMAREELQEIISADECSNERKIFALYYMGETEQSKVMLDEMARNSELAATATETENDMPSEVMSFYNLACVYSLLGDIDRALYFLERYYAEDNTATEFDYAILDDDLNNARKSPQFMEIINRYKQKWLNGELNLKK